LNQDQLLLNRALHQQVQENLYILEFGIQNKARFSELQAHSIEATGFKKFQQVSLTIEGVSWEGQETLILMVEKKSVNQE
jgi:hypothetical protein